MEEVVSILDPPVPRPTAEQPEALRMLKDWECGRITLGPEGLAQILRLQRAQVGHHMATTLAFTEAQSA